MERILFAVVCLFCYISIMILGYSIFNALKILTKEVKNLVTILTIKEDMKTLKTEIEEIKGFIFKGGGQPTSEPDPDDSDS